MNALAFKMRTDMKREAKLRDIFVMTLLFRTDQTLHTGTVDGEFLKTVILACVLSP